MNKQVILLRDATAGPAFELIKSLDSLGISVLVKDFDDLYLLPEEPTPHSLVLLYDVVPGATVEDLRSVIEQTGRIWHGVSIIACRQRSTKSAALRLAVPDNATLKRLGFRAVADDPTQLPALLRQVEETPGTGELKLPQEFKSAPDS